MERMIRQNLKSSYFSVLIVLFLLLFPLFISAQSRLKCDYCGKNIAGNYIEADGRHFHPAHFLCAKCGKVITGPFSEDDDNFYHPDCYAAKEGLVCAYCNKLIKGEYVESEGKKFHQGCYEKVLPKCSVCGKSLDGEYTVDIYNNKYHSYHNRELDKCDNCDRIISDRTTGGGRTYSDGRHICSQCSQGAVFDNARINAMLGMVLHKLRNLGLNIDESNVSVRGVDRKELQRAAGNRYDSNMHGICNTSSRTEYINNRQGRTTKKHEIFVLNGVPPLNIESVIAHELMHVWLNENTKDDHPAQLREGSCNYISFLYLKSINNSKSEQIVNQLENDPDNTYGKGFQRVRSEFAKKSLGQLLSYLKRY